MPNTLLTFDTMRKLMENDMSHKPFDPQAIKIGDRVLTPDGDVITVRGVLHNVSEMYNAKLCKAAPDGDSGTHLTKAAAADSGDVVIWGD